MRIYDDQLARNRCSARLARAPARRTIAQRPGRANASSVEALDPTAVLNLQRLAGNAAVTDCS